MKILWVVNVIIPRIQKMQGRTVSSIYGGWLSGISDHLLKEDGFEICICYPERDTKEEIKGKKDKFSYCGLPMIGDAYKKVFLNRVKEYKPDVIHFFGTEFSWSYELLKVCERNGYLSQSVLSIQGLVSVCYERFFSGLPFLTRYKFTLSELKGRNSLYHIFCDYKKRGISEMKEITLAQNVITRTTWDKACVKHINNNINCYFCNETLREEFYSDKWEYENCRKFSIYVSQASKPIKGFHIFLKALKIVVSKYPDAMVYVAGNNVIKGNWIKGSSYGMYIKHLMKQYNLERNVVFLGELNAQQVKEQLLNTNVFVSASSIENSPNSLGEAMLLGVPCVASDVGGVTDMMTHKEEGYVYPFDEYHLLAHYIIEIFQNASLASSISIKARKHALETHDADKNNETLMHIYQELSRK